jgi:LmbE family N-acetylglucosaminyl deacetylase
MKILIIAPHMDDEALGCGGTISRYVNEGHDVHVVFVAHRIYNHTFDRTANELERESTLRAKKILGYQTAIFLDLSDERLDMCLQEIIIPLEKVVQDFMPDIVLLCHRGDNHQDHRAVFHAARVVLRPSATQFIKKILCYEVPSSTEQSPSTPMDYFMPNIFVNIENTLTKKMDAIKMYQREGREFPHPRSHRAVEVLAYKRGIESGYNDAEAFMLFRERYG